MFGWLRRLTGRRVPAKQMPMGRSAFPGECTHPADARVSEYETTPAGDRVIKAYHCSKCGTRIPLDEAARIHTAEEGTTGL